MSKCVIAGAPCPQTSDSNAKRFCPAWWETTATNDATGEVRLTKGCAWTQLPEYFNFLAREARGASASSQAARNSVDALAPQLNDGFRAVALTLHAGRHAKTPDEPTAAEHRTAETLGVLNGHSANVPADSGRVE